MKEGLEPPGNSSTSRETGGRGNAASTISAMKSPMSASRKRARQLAAEHDTKSKTKTWSFQRDTDTETEEEEEEEEEQEEEREGREGERAFLRLWLRSMS